MHETFILHESYRKDAKTNNMSKKISCDVSLISKINLIVLKYVSVTFLILIWSSNFLFIFVSVQTFDLCSYDELNETMDFISSQYTFYL